MTTPKKPITLNEWQEMFNLVYGQTNSTLSPIQMWLHLMEEAGEVARDMRKEDYASLANDLPDLFAWLCSFSNQTGIKIEQAVWEKYPKICPYCLRSNNCVCISEGFSSYDSRRLNRYQKNNSKPDSLESWEEMFKNIFGNVNRILSRASIGFHLMEEIGEVASLLRRNDFDNYSVEIADVFAWVVAIPMKMPELGTLSEMAWSVYPGMCKRCKMHVCGCEGNLTGPRL
ncbi:MAG: hypothetical protein H6660_11175 [Ardenticatenaceae bacterium]|nr:hypothetical protein [Ardenticatenaceae bacterium]